MPKFLYRRFLEAFQGFFPTMSLVSALHIHHQLERGTCPAPSSCPVVSCRVSWRLMCLLPSMPRLSAPGRLLFTLA